jgi:polyhydroxyalkanoate synthesis regulator phasin
MLSQVSRKTGASAGDGWDGVVGRARQAAEDAVRDLRKRLPAELVEPVDRAVAGGQRALQAGLRRLEEELGRTTTRDDVDRLTKRIDALTRRIESLVREATRKRGGPDA